MEDDTTKTTAVVTAAPPAQGAARGGEAPRSGGGLVVSSDPTRSWLAAVLPASAPDLGSYPDLGDLAGTEPVARDAVRERAFAAAGGAGAPAEVLREHAAWLAAQGDPRGELIRLQASDKRLDARRAARWLRRHRRYFLGNFPCEAGDWYSDEVMFAWRAGFLDRAELALVLDPLGPSPAAVLRALFRLPSARWLRALALRVEPWAWQNPGHHPLSRWTEPLLESGGAPALRVLELARVPHAGGAAVEESGEFGPNPEGDGWPANDGPARDEALCGDGAREDLAALARAFPRLERVVLDGAEIALQRVPRTNA